MKTLSLLRHATAVRDPRFTDHERPLEPVGEAEAHRLGIALRGISMRFDRVLASSAVRTATTASLLLQAMGHGGEEFEIDRRLYASTPQRLLSVIGQVTDQANHLLIVGHNPELSDLANRFSSDVGELDPCTCVSFEFEVDSWLGLELAVPVSVAIRRPSH